MRKRFLVTKSSINYKGYYYIPCNKEVEVYPRVVGNFNQLLFQAGQGGYSEYICTSIQMPHNTRLHQGSLQSYSHQDSVVLTKNKRINETEQRTKK